MTGIPLVQGLAGKPGRTFYFMRHGQTAFNAAGAICGRLEPPLDAAGRQQAQDAGARLAGLPFDFVAVSPQLRARQTALLAVPQSAPLVFDGLRERDWGDLEGRPLAEQCAYRDTPPGGEPWDDFLARVLDALRQLLAAHEQPLVIAHSGVWRAMRTLATGAPDGPRIANAAPAMVVLSGGLLAGTTMVPAQGGQRPGAACSNVTPAAQGCRDIPVFYL